MEKIGIFCSASGSIDPIYFDAAHQIGEWMGKNGKTLIYGGANLGLMECVAKAVKENGGHVIGVVPSKLEENGKVSTYPDEIIATHDLSGGIGTLDEVFHVMAAASIGYHQKKVIFYNADGFYNPLLAVLSELQARGFTRHPLSSYYEVANTFNELTIKI